MGNSCRLTLRLLAVGPVLTGVGQEAASQYTPWEPIVVGQATPYDYFGQEIVSAGALGQLSMNLSCRNEPFLIRIHVEKGTPFDTTAAQSERPVFVRWDRDASAEYIFIRHPNKGRTLLLSSKTSPQAADFVSRWLRHGRMRVRLPATRHYPLPVFESWSLTGTSAEWNALGCVHPDSLNE